MLDLDKLEARRETATRDKADLFDFYHEHWDEVIAALRVAQDRLHAIELHHELQADRAKKTSEALQQGKRVV